MAFSQANVSALQVTPVASSAVVRLAWSTTAPAGTWFQVYANARLVWFGLETRCELPWPTVATHYEVGTVGVGEQGTNFAASLPTQPARGIASLSWYGGRYLDPGTHDVTAFHVYGESSPGGGISYVSPLATVPAQPGAVPLDGFGRGRFGEGRFGYAEVAYAWESDPVSSSGTWHYAITAYGSSGNESSVATVAVAITRPPNPPAPNSAGQRLTYSYTAGTGVVTLNWNASP